MIERKPGQLWSTMTYHTGIEIYLLLKRVENKKQMVKKKQSQAWSVLVEGVVETWYESAMRDDILISETKDTYLHENH